VLGRENPHERDLPKVSVLCALIKKQNYQSFLFEEPMKRGDNFLAMMEKTALRHVPVETIFHVGGAPPHIYHHSHAFLVREFPDLWTGRRLIPWPPHSPDLTSLDFFLLGRL
jgi:hypothetical protein